MLSKLAYLTLCRSIQLLALLNLVADARIVAAAHRIDKIFWELNLRVGRGELEGPRWFAERDRMEDARLDFVNTARHLLARPGPKLTRLHGRPEPSDPIWDVSRRDQSEPVAERPEQV